MLRKITLATAVSALALLGACSTGSNVATSPGSPTSSTSGNYATYGYVRSIETVSKDARPSGAGAVLGAVVGAALGNQIGGGSGRTAATVGGAVAGGVAGHQIEKHQKKDDEVYRISVRFDNGNVSTYDYQRIDDLRVGDRVKLENGTLHRV